ncbi:MAG: TfoX/Sxy family protein [Actinomycetes bacterium]
MKMPKPTEADLDRFRSALPEDPRVEVKPMFGQLGAFVNGNMFAGLFGADVGVKLDDPALVELRNAGGTPFGPAERPMSGYLSLPAEVRDDPAAAEGWVRRSFAHVAAMPPKVKAAKKAKG